MECEKGQDVLLSASGVSKRYGGYTALDGLDMELLRGRIYGFIGENGAGKTTAIRIIAGLSKPTGGTLCLFGESDEKGLRAARAKMGFLIESPAVYESMTGAQNLEIHCLLRGFDPKSLVSETLDLVGLRPDDRRSVKHYSLGMRQRLGLAIALLGNPEFLVLDEPINGLDPTGVHEMRCLLEGLNRDRGTTILVSSHILSELSQTATDYIFLHRGRVVDEFSNEEFAHTRKRTFCIITSDQMLAARFFQSRFPDAEISRGADGEIVVAGELLDFGLTEMAREIEAQGLEVDTLTCSDETLEDRFLATVRGDI